MMKNCPYRQYSWRDIVAWLPVTGLLMVLSALPFEWSAYQRIGLCVLAGGYAADYILNKRWQQFVWDRGKWMYVVMLAIVAMFFIREWFDSTELTDYAFSQFHLHEWFLYIGIAGIAGFSDKLQLKHVAYVMLGTSIVMLMLCIGLCLTTNEYDYLEPFFRFNMIRRHHINSHMVMNLYINTAIIVGFSMLRSEPAKWRKGLVLAAILLSWLLILISDGRTGQVTSVLVMAACLIYALPRKHWYIGAAAGALFAIILGVFIANNPRVSLDKMANDPRLAIYDYSWRMIQKEPVKGYGLSTLSIKYVEEAYLDSVMYNGYIRTLQAYPEFAELGKTMKTHHSHNAFLHYWLIFGISGPILLLALFGTAARMPIDKKYRFYLWLFLLTVFIQCITEPVGQHIKPQFITFILIIWQCAKLPDTSPKTDVPCES